MNSPPNEDNTDVEMNVFVPDSDEPEAQDEASESSGPEPETFSLEDGIDRWQKALLAKPGISRTTVDEMTDHLHSHVEKLTEAGLNHEEALLIGIKRMGSQSDAAKELAAVHTALTWKRLTDDETSTSNRSGGWQSMVLHGVVLGLGIWLFTLVLRFVDIEAPMLRPVRSMIGPILLLTPFVLASAALSSYLGWRRQLSRRQWAVVGAIYLAMIGLLLGVPALDDNGGVWPLFRLRTHEQFQVITPIGLVGLSWLCTAYAYTGGRFKDHGQRINFVRYTGEWFTYLGLVIIASAVIQGLFTVMFDIVGIDVFSSELAWLFYSAWGGIGLIACTWMVESKQHVVENLLPVLARLFSPLLTLMLTVFLCTVPFLGDLAQLDREALIVFTIALAAVFGLVLYSWSARDADAPAGKADWVQVALLGTGLAVNFVVLAAMSVRIQEFGVTPNRLATLGSNLMLTFNLSGMLYLYIRCIRHTGGFAALERWQARFLVGFVAWTLVVVTILPLAFLQPLD